MIKDLISISIDTVPFDHFILQLFHFVLVSSGWIRFAFSFLLFYSLSWMNHQLSGYSLIVWACVSVVHNGDWSLAIVVYSLRLLLSDGFSLNWSNSMDVGGVDDVGRDDVVDSNDRLLIICWNCFNFELKSSSSRPMPLIELIAPLVLLLLLLLLPPPLPQWLLWIWRKPRWRREDFGLRCVEAIDTIGIGALPSSCVPTITRPLLVDSSIVAIVALGAGDIDEVVPQVDVVAVVVVVVVVSVAIVVVSTHDAFISDELTVSFLSSVVIWMVMLAVVLINC